MPLYLLAKITYHTLPLTLKIKNSEGKYFFIDITGGWKIIINEASRLYFANASASEDDPSQS